MVGRLQQRRVRPQCSISFTLRATGTPRSAMWSWCRPRGVAARAVASGERDRGNQAPASTVLTIRFVRVEHGHVSGTLDPYADPQTGARLLTRFTGEVNGNMITGTYTTQLPSGAEQTGRWSVQRR